MALRTLPRNTTVAATISTDIDNDDQPYMAVFIEILWGGGVECGGDTYEFRRSINHIDEGVAIVRRWCVERSIPVPPIYYIGECDPRVTFWIHTHASEPNTLQERQGLVG